MTPTATPCEKVNIPNETMALIASHRSIRRFRPDALEESALQTIISVGQQASTETTLRR